MTKSSRWNIYSGLSASSDLSSRFLAWTMILSFKMIESWKQKFLALPAPNWVRLHPTLYVTSARFFFSFNYLRLQRRLHRPIVPAQIVLLCFCLRATNSRNLSFLLSLFFLLRIVYYRAAKNHVFFLPFFVAQLIYSKMNSFSCLVSTLLQTTGKWKTQNLIATKILISTTGYARVHLLWLTIAT